ncbi:hypothetical protein [Flavitalea sp.]|nr:hypothetical protein [Flavitalea sp.]
MKVFDQQKQRIPTETLVEKQYIRIEPAEELKQRVSQQQKPEQTQKQEHATSQKQKQNQKQAQGQKQKNDAPVKKQTRKQKVK